MNQPNSNPWADNLFQQESVGQNPFEQQPQAGPRYVLTRSGPELDDSELEQPQVMALEVMILWGDSVQHVAHLVPPRSYYVGEEQRAHAECDFLVPAEVLGATRAPLVVVENEVPYALVLPKATGWIKLPGQGRVNLNQARRMGLLKPCAEVQGALRVELSLGVQLEMSVGPMVFRLAAVHAGQKPAAGWTDRDWSTSLYVGMSMAVHAGLLAVFGMFMPPLGLVEDGTTTPDQVYLMQQLLRVSAEREQEARPEQPSPANEGGGQREGGTGSRAPGAEGQMGNPSSTRQHGAYGVAGPRDNDQPRIARASEVQMASTFGLIGVLNSGFGHTDAPTAPWGEDDALGRDLLSARGHMWGDAIQDAHGAGGLGLTGIGEGSNGTGLGIGLGSVGTIGRGAGLGDGQGFGNDHGLIGRGRAAQPPRVRFMGTTTTGGRLPPEIIQRVVRQNYGRFRLCYENGLRGNPTLQGRVSVRFVIGRDGSVSQVGNGGSDLSDPAVTACVTSAFRGLSFPAPQDGIVTVVYPIVFTPGG